jgi:hypothetical protein
MDKMIFVLIVLIAIVGIVFTPRPSKIIEQEVPTLEPELKRMIEKENPAPDQSPKPEEKRDLHGKVV